MKTDKPIIVGTVKNGVIVPHVACVGSLDGLEGRQVVLTLEDDQSKQRSAKMRASLQVYCRKLAAALNDAGYDQRQLMANIGKGAPIPSSETSIKSLWKTVIDLRRGKPSTTMSTNGEMCEDYQVFDSMISKACHGVSIPWPSIEGLKAEQYNNE